MTSEEELRREKRLWEERRFERRVWMTLSFLAGILVGAVAGVWLDSVDAVMGLTLLGAGVVWLWIQLWVHIGHPLFREVNWRWWSWWYRRKKKD